MRKTCVLYILSAIVSASLIGCGARYMMGGETFSSSSEALQRQSENLARVLDNITPTDKPVHGRGLVLFPSDVEILKNHIKFSNSSFKNSLQKEQIDYLVSATRNDFQFMADAIRNRGIFVSVSVERHAGNPASFCTWDYDFMIFADIDGWFVKGREYQLPLAVVFDKSLSDMEARHSCFP